jgi:hypothetical protein
MVTLGPKLEGALHVTSMEVLSLGLEWVAESWKLMVRFWGGGNNKVLQNNITSSRDNWLVWNANLICPPPPPTPPLIKLMSKKNMTWYSFVITLYSCTNARWLPSCSKAFNMNYFNNCILYQEQVSLKSWEVLGMRLGTNYAYFQVFKCPMEIRFEFEACNHRC